MIDLLPFTVENVETVPICGEEILMVVPDEVIEKAYPGQLDDIRHSLSSSTDIRLLEQMSFCPVKGATGSAPLQTRYLRDAQMSPRVVLETENIETVLALCRKGMGVTFYPKMFMATDQSASSPRQALLEHSRLNLYSP